MTKTVDVVREWLDIVGNGPATRWAGKVADDIVIRFPYAFPGAPTELRGLDQAIAGLTGWWEGNESFAWRDVVIRQTDDPEWVVTTARSETVLKSGKLYNNNYVMMTRVRGGKIIEHLEYFNPLIAMAAFGVA